ncbi:trypsin-like peptidase domain-containing protein [Streptomyces umbrinus]|uniref:trypsin-like peptidase domain-containing protein n=1 Tax=Streptomyces umbrinus TaxID=67370 RepID=UPI00340DF4E0
MTTIETAHEDREQQAALAAQRYRAASAERHALTQEIEAGRKYPDSPQAIAARAGRLLERGAIPPSATVASIHAQALDMPEALERIIGASNDMQAWSFLPRGARAARAVTRIKIRHNGRELPHGTGFLVSPRLLLTNHHVFPHPQFAAQCVLEFNAQVTIDNTPDTQVQLEPDPATFFTADQHLDFALVAVSPTTDGHLPGDAFGWHRLSAQLGKLVIGEPVNIIGHPSGRPKEIAVRNNALQVRLDDFLHYTTDTEPGNSGSPVFNDQWEVVALHHSGVRKLDAQGRVLRKDGQIWQPGDGDDAIDYVSNEGVRISSILKVLATLPLDSAQRALLAEMGPESGLPPSLATPAPHSENHAPTAPAPEAAATGTGRPAHSTARTGGRHLVFLHGRNQQGRDPEILRRNWSAGLNHGLTRAGIPTIEPANVWFPYYGDEIVQAMGQRETLTAAIEDITPATAAAEAFAAASPTGSYERLLEEAAVKQGMPQNGPAATEGFAATLAGATHRALNWLAAKTDMDALTIATLFRDVDAYLGDERIREAVLARVLATLPPTGDIVLVTHSLGTVVGMDLIERLPDQMNLPLLVTAGSPLGMDTVYSRLLTQGPKRPAKVSNWINVWCPTDAVATGCPLHNTWGKITDLAVANARDRAHSIEEYLAHPGVASEIGHALPPA